MDAFVTPARRARFQEALESDRKRPKLLDRLNQGAGDFESRILSLVPRRQQFPAELEELLKGKGAPETCYLVSSSRALDRRELPLREALEAVVGQGPGTLISCIPGRLAYFEGKGPEARYILERPDMG